MSSLRLFLDEEYQCGDFEWDSKFSLTLRRSLNPEGQRIKNMCMD